MSYFTERSRITYCRLVKIGWVVLLLWLVLKLDMRELTYIQGGNIFQECRILVHVIHYELVFVSVKKLILNNTMNIVVNSINSINSYSLSQSEISGWTGQVVRHSFLIASYDKILSRVLTVQNIDLFMEPWLH